MLFDVLSDSFSILLMLSIQIRLYICCGCGLLSGELISGRKFYS